MKPMSADIIRNHTERALAILHLVNEQVADGAPLNDRARRNLELCADYIQSIQNRESKHDRAA